MQKFSLFQCMCLSHTHTSIQKLILLPYFFKKYFSNYQYIITSHFSSISPHGCNTSNHLVSLSNLYSLWNYLQVFKPEK